MINESAIHHSLVMKCRQVFKVGAWAARDRERETYWEPSVSQSADMNLFVGDGCNQGIDTLEQLGSRWDMSGELEAGMVDEGGHLLLPGSPVASQLAGGTQLPRCRCRCPSPHPVRTCVLKFGTELKLSTGIVQAPAATEYLINVIHTDNATPSRR